MNYVGVNVPNHIPSSGGSKITDKTLPIFISDYHIELSRSESLTRYSGLVNIFKYLDN